MAIGLSAGQTRPIEPFREQGTSVNHQSRATGQSSAHDARDQQATETRGEQVAACEAKRIFRGVTYNIRGERKSSADSIRLIVDGQAIEGFVIPIPLQGTNEVDVLVELG